VVVHSHGGLDLAKEELAPAGRGDAGRPRRAELERAGGWVRRPLARRPGAREGGACVSVDGGKLAGHGARSWSGWMVGFVVRSHGGPELAREGACASVDGGSCRDHGGRSWRGWVVGFVVRFARRPGSSRGRSLRQRGRGKLAGLGGRSWSGWMVGFVIPRGRGSRGWPGGSRSPEPRGSAYREVSICGLLLPLLPPGLLVAEVVRSCGNPGAVDGGRDFQRLWEGPGAGGRWPGTFHIRSASTAWEGGKLRLPAHLRRVAMTSARFACGPAWPRADLRAGLRAAIQSRVRTCVRLCASRVRTCVRLCAARFCSPHPPSPPSDCLSRGWGTPKSGTKLGEVLVRRSKIFSLRIRWARIATALCRAGRTRIGW